MPNWCVNDGWITPRTEEGKQIFEKLKQFKDYDESKDPDKTEGLMSLVMPRPKEMWLGVGGGVSVKQEYLSLKWLQEHSDFNGEFGSFTVNSDGQNEFHPSTEYQQYLLDTFKAVNWYDWGLEHWGCKWDIYPDSFEIKEEENKIVFSFLSAWCDPMHFFAWLSNHGLDFHRSYDEPGEQWVGRHIVKDGVEVENSCATGDDYFLWKLKEWSHIYTLENMMGLTDYTSYEDFKENHYAEITNEELVGLLKEYYEQKPTPE